MKVREDMLMNQIREKLRQFEDPYVPGAWEDFNAKPANRKTVFFWKPSRIAAAILLIGAGLFLMMHHPPLSESTASKSMKADTLLKPDRQSRIASKTEKRRSESIFNIKRIKPLRHIDRKAGSPILIANQTAADNPAISNEHILQNDPEFHNSPPHSSGANPITSKVTFTNDSFEDKENKTSLKISFQEFLENEGKAVAEVIPEKSAKRHAEKWEPGLIISPSYGNTRKLNMGYGFTLAYALSDKIDLSSGISYSEMAAARRFEQPESMILTGNRNLEKAESSVSGIDMPLEVRYHLTKNIYANVGVSAFAVLEQNASNTYIEARTVDRIVPTNAGGKELRTFIENHRTTSKISGEHNDQLIGLYNVSLGYKRTVLKNQAVSVEPFLKMPLRKSDGNGLSMRAAGVRFKLEF